jgi:uncharacterized protein (TIGR00251 family)
MIGLKPHALGTVLPVKAQPGAKRDAILGERAEALRVAVTAAPERGKANEAIAALLAKLLGLKGSQLSLLSGESARDKRFLIEGVSPEDLRSRLEAAISDNART